MQRGFKRGGGGQERRATHVCRRASKEPASNTVPQSRSPASGSSRPLLKRLAASLFKEPGQPCRPCLRGCAPGWGCRRATEKGTCAGESAAQHSGKRAAGCGVGCVYVRMEMQPVAGWLARGSCKAAARGRASVAALAGMQRQRRRSSTHIRPAAHSLLQVGQGVTAAGLGEGAAVMHAAAAHATPWCCSTVVPAISLSRPAHTPRTAAACPPRGCSHLLGLGLGVWPSVHFQPKKSAGGGRGGMRRSGALGACLAQQACECLRLLPLATKPASCPTPCTHHSLCASPNRRASGTRPGAGRPTAPMPCQRRGSCRKGGGAANGGSAGEARERHSA